jgi:hypothetical protein
MTTLILTFIIVLFLVTSMSVGVLFGRKPITGSCGGLQGLDPDRECELCGGDPAKCTEI